MINPRNHVQERRFAVTRWPDDHDKLTAMHLKGNAFQDRYFCLSDNKPFENFLDINQ
jgi:hypothetical protein